MITEIVSVSINSQVQDDLVPDIVEVEVEESVEAADVFRLKVSIALQDDGTWSYIDDPRFAVWSRLSVQAGYPDDNDTIIDGYVTHVKVSLSGSEDSFVEVSGMDATAMMDLEEKQLAWVAKKDNEIAQEVFQAYGLSYVVEDTVYRPDESLATVLQTESDIRFLRRLAARNGFECYVKGSTGYFRSPNLQDPPQKLLAINFGSDSNVTSMRVEVDGTPPTFLEIRRVDPMEKSEDKETLEDMPRRVIGQNKLQDLRASASTHDGRRLLKRQISASTDEMKAKLRSGYEPASEFVTVSADVDSRSYGSVLRAKRLVNVKGASKSYSGLYYVTKVRHRFTSDGYEQSFEGYRNGIGMTGDEDFSSPPDLLPIVPGAPSASVSTGNLVLPAQQGASTIPGGS